jgi:hypothetical protein
MSDKPTNVLNVNDLDLEGKAEEPIRVPLKGASGFVTFPSPFDRDAEDAEKFLASLYAGMSNGQVTPIVKEWLSDEDFKKFRKSYPSYRATLTIVSAVVERMEATWGTPGEGDASES